jgi:hypothetical protein
MLDILIPSLMKSNIYDSTSVGPMWEIPRLANT